MYIIANSLSLVRKTGFLKNLSVFKRFNVATSYISHTGQFPPSTNAISFTRPAVERLSALSLSGDSLNIKVSSGGCHGYQYDLTLAKTPESIESITSSIADHKKADDNIEDDDFDSNEVTYFKLPFLTPDKRDLIGLARSIKKNEPAVAETNNINIETGVSSNSGPDIYVSIDSDSLALLNGTTLDFQRELIGSSFKIIGGNMKSSCGCGSSFDL
ncbi:hypothetical protein QEN19_003783 [Hanseniaspora menglaensis]